MNNKNKDLPAFPIESFPSEIDKKGKIVSYRAYSGMSIRQYIATRAMQGIVSNAQLLKEMSEKLPYGYTEEMYFENIAKVSIMQADALIKALEYDNEPCGCAGKSECHGENHV